MPFVVDCEIPAWAPWHYDLLQDHAPQAFMNVRSHPPKTGEALPALISLTTRLRRSQHPPRGCNLRLCSKVYGNGGVLSHPGYLLRYAAHLRSVGVRQAVIYAIEQLPDSLIHALRDHRVGDVITLRNWSSTPFTAAEAELQHQLQSSQVEAVFRGALAH